MKPGRNLHPATGRARRAHRQEPAPTLDREYSRQFAAKKARDAVLRGETKADRFPWIEGMAVAVALLGVVYVVMGLVWGWR